MVEADPDNRVPPPQRSVAPGNHERRLAEISRQKAAEFRAQRKYKLARNAEAWAKELEERQAAHEATGKVVHWSAVPRGVCARKDADADVHVLARDKNDKPAAWATGVASHFGNVDCIVCRRWARSNPRRTWKCEHGTLLTAKCKRCDVEFAKAMTAATSR